MKHNLRPKITAFFFTIAVLLTLVNSSHAKTILQEADFQIQNQNMWGGAPGEVMNWQVPQNLTSVSWNASGSMSAISGGILDDVCIGVVILGVCIGVITDIDTRTGFALGGATDGQFGVDVSGRMGPGDVDVRYPIDVALNIPDTDFYNPGDTFSNYLFLFGRSCCILTN